MLTLRVYIIFHLIDRYFTEQWTIAQTMLGCLLVITIAVLIMNVINYKFILPYLYPEHPIKLMFDTGSHLYHAFNLSSVVGMASAIKLARKQLRSKMNEQILIT